MRFAAVRGSVSSVASEKFAVTTKMIAKARDAAEVWKKIAGPVAEFPPLAAGPPHPRRPPTRTARMRQARPRPDHAPTLGGAARGHEEKPRQARAARQGAPCHPGLGLHATHAPSARAGCISRSAGAN